MFFYILYITGYTLANILPLNLAYWLAERISDIQYYFGKKDREAVAENLNVILKKDIEECRILAQKVFRNFGLYLVDFFRMTRLDREAVKRRVRFEGLENLEGLVRQDRGVIILSCHLGNWEMGGVVVALMGYKISAVALTHRHKGINNFFIGQRERKGMKVISINSIMKRCVSTLLKKEILALVGDRDFTNSGITLDFFGVPTSIPKGPAALSLKTNSPILPVFFVREERYGYKLIFDKPIETQETPGTKKSEVIKNTTERFLPVMEKYIKMYPEQWLVFRRFWETPADVFIL